MPRLPVLHSRSRLLSILSSFRISNRIYRLRTGWADSAHLTAFSGETPGTAAAGAFVLAAGVFETAAAGVLVLARFVELAAATFVEGTLGIGAGRGSAVKLVFSCGLARNKASFRWEAVVFRASPGCPPGFGARSSL